LVSKPWTICSRREIGELLYGPQHTVGDRAIDVIVNRLRKKLASVGGDDAEHLIKTEFRRGYLLVTEVATLPQEASARPRALLASAG
jgi:DNA-binding response OmpR family regulator